MHPVGGRIKPSPVSSVASAEKHWISGSMRDLPRGRTGRMEKHAGALHMATMPHGLYPPPPTHAQEGAGRQAQEGPAGSAHV
jgi:hypothetical protein